MNRQSNLTSDNCPICSTKLTIGIDSWHFVCKNCKYEKSDLEPTINLLSSHQLIDEGHRETGLHELRMKNFKILLANLKLLKPDGGSLLDVGCAHGWFLDAAKNDYKVMGLEPDKNIFDATLRRGQKVRMGYFPDALESKEHFDIIVFNDVIEHIPDIRSTLISCHKHLNQDGLLIVNLPSSNGLFYVLSKIFSRLGFTGFFERLWQKDLPSPHLHYFNSSNLIDFINDNGFKVCREGKLSTLSLAGLYTRVSYTGNLNFVARIFLCVFIIMLLPILKILPSDIIYVIARRK